MAKLSNFTVKVFEAPALSSFAGRADKHGRAVPPPKPKPLPSVTVAARSIDDARTQARKKLTGRGRLQSLSVVRDGTIQAILMHPEDAARDIPRA